MKIKCDDGKVREFAIAKADGFGGYEPPYCRECGKEFTKTFDTKIAKPKFKQHVCNNDK